MLEHLAPVTNVEHITLATSGAAAAQGSFSILTTEQVRDVLIQNTTAAACYVTWGTSAVTAASSSAYLAANANISIDNCSYTHFSVIRSVGDVSLRITGNGRNR